MPRIDGPCRGLGKRERGRRSERESCEERTNVSHWIDGLRPVVIEQGPCLGVYPPIPVIYTEYAAHNEYVTRKRLRGLSGRRKQDRALNGHAVRRQTRNVQERPRGGLANGADGHRRSFDRHQQEVTFRGP